MSLDFIVVGTGRDGTVTMTKLIEEIFQLNNLQGTVCHEYAAGDFYNEFCAYQLSGDSVHQDSIRKLIVECPYRAIVGNGYATVLPIFKEIYPNIKLIHLIRADKDAFVRSMVKNAKLFPESHKNYVDSEGLISRTAAFHVGEMTETEWNDLSIDARFRWYYDYTHKEIEKYKPIW